jgi:hypothetical protein
MRLFVRVFVATCALLLLFVVSAPRGRVVVGAVMVARDDDGILKHTDRCDVRGCGARAYVRGLFEPLTDEQRTSAVDLCAHHFSEREEKIRATAYHVIDERSKILAAS